jgi:hypothetical protein
MKTIVKFGIVLIAAGLAVVLIFSALLANTVTVTRHWTTPEYAESGEYDLRYTTDAADTTTTRLSWPGWVEGIHVPGVVGTPDSQLVEGLQPNTVYYFAIWSHNEYGWSEISNIVVDTTGAVEIWPAAITDFR